MTAVPQLGRRCRLLVLATCCASALIAVMDISIVNVAPPSIGHDLRASESGLQWTVDAYTLVLASFLVLGGSTADRVGRRRVFQAGLAVFGLGSPLCGPAPGIGWLIATRVALVGGLGWRAVFRVNVPIVAAAIVGARFVPESRAARARGFDPVGQTLVLLTLGSLVYAIISAGRQ